MRIIILMAILAVFLSPANLLACELGQIQSADKKWTLSARQASVSCNSPDAPKQVNFVTGEPISLDVKLVPTNSTLKSKLILKAVSLTRKSGESSDAKPNVRAIAEGSFFVDNIEFNAPAVWTIAFTVLNGKNKEVLKIDLPVQLSEHQAKQIAANTAHAPAFSFTNIDGKTITLADLKDKIWVVDFFFASCPSICPLMTQKMAGLQKQFKNAPNLRFVSVTTDPETDTPKALGAFAKKYKANTKTWYFLNGPKKDVVAFSKNGLNLEVSDTTVMHSTRFGLVGADGIVKGAYDSTKTAELEQLRIDLKELLAKQSK